MQYEREIRICGGDLVMKLGILEMKLGLWYKEISFGSHTCLLPNELLEKKFGKKQAYALNNFKIFHPSLL